MVALRPGTPEYEALFGANFDLDDFRSALPTHQQLQNAWLDPSVREGLGLDDAAKIFAKQTKDLQKGAQGLLWTMTTDLSVKGAALANMPTELLSGVRSVIKSTPILSSLSEIDTFDTFDAAGSGKAGKVVGSLALGVGLAAVGTSVPVVGQIAAVVVFLGKAIYSVIHMQKVKRQREDAAAREALYESFPPLQTADSMTDEGLVNNQLRPILQTQDWTRIFCPRFRGKMWVGIERDKGFAFAPGEATEWSDEFGGDKGEAFQASGGVGLIPGTNVLTSVIQVNLDPRGTAFQNFLKGGQDPRGSYSAFNPTNGSNYIIDTGSFYVATARLAGLVWEWATKPRSPFLYRLDCIQMHDEWKNYCDLGIDYLRERVFPWYSKMANGDGTRKAENLEGFFGSAVYYGVGSWACYVTGGTNHHPIWTKFDIPSGWYREEMARGGLYPDSISSGAFLPILGQPSKGFQNCMGTIYQRTPAIRDVLNQLQARQRHSLQTSLVGAYVRRTDAAFAGDPTLAVLLDKVRDIMLTHEARFAINMLDVPVGEKHRGKDWVELLLAAGVPKYQNKLQAGVNRLSMGAKDGEPEPELPPLRVGNPVPPAWNPRPKPDGRPYAEGEPASAPGGVARWARAQPVVAGAAGFGTLFAAGWALSKVFKRKSGPL